MTRKTNTLRWIAGVVAAIASTSFTQQSAEAATSQLVATVYAGSTQYTVQPGDSLWKISLRFHVGWPDIYQANNNAIAKSTPELPPTGFSI